MEKSWINHDLPKTRQYKEKIICFGTGDVTSFLVVNSFLFESDCSLVGSIEQNDHLMMVMLWNRICVALYLHRIVGRWTMMNIFQQSSWFQQQRSDRWTSLPQLLSPSSKSSFPFSSLRIHCWISLMLFSCWSSSFPMVLVHLQSCRNDSSSVVEAVNLLRNLLRERSYAMYIAVQPSMHTVLLYCAFKPTIRSFFYKKVVCKKATLQNPKKW